MRIEVNNGEVGKALSESPHDGISNRVIAAQAHWSLSPIEQLADCAFYSGELTIRWQFQVARIQQRL